MNSQKIHIGRLIREKMKEERRSVIWLADEIGCERDAVYKIFDKQSIDVDLILRISIALKINFFCYYSDYYRDKYG